MAIFLISIKLNKIPFRNSAAIIRQILFLVKTRKTSYIEHAYTKNPGQCQVLLKKYLFCSHFFKILSLLNRKPTTIKANPMVFKKLSPTKNGTIYPSLNFIHSNPTANITKKSNATIEIITNNSHLDHILLMAMISSLSFAKISASVFSLSN